MVTNYEIMEDMPAEEKQHYVYLWYHTEGERIIPFYVGIGTKNRWKTKTGRSKTFAAFIKDHDNCKSMIVACNLPYFIARKVEIKTKEELKARGFIILDGEDDREERKKRQKEGYAAMKERNEWYKMGRPKLNIDLADFKNIVQKRKEEGLTVTGCCRQLGISRSTWYTLLREIL